MNIGLVEHEIEQLFSQIKLIKEQKGYAYLKDAVLYYTLDDSYKGSIYRRLFDKVAKNHHTNGYCVERDIRHVLECTWTKEYTDQQYELYGCVIASDGGKPSIANFIQQSAKLIKQNLRM